MKKFIAIVLCFVLTAAVLTACRGKSPEETAGPTTTTASETEVTTQPTTMATMPTIQPTDDTGTMDDATGGTGDSTPRNRRPQPIP